jgi:hypothetical protein
LLLEQLEEVLQHTGFDGIGIATAVAERDMAAGVDIAGADIADPWWLAVGNTLAAAGILADGGPRAQPPGAKRFALPAKKLWWATGMKTLLLACE